MRRSGSALVFAFVGIVFVACSATELGGSDPPSSADASTTGEPDATTTPPTSGTDATTAADSTTPVSDAASPTDAAADVATEAAADAGADAEADSGAEAGDAGVCPYFPDPVSAACPPECTGGCAGGVCNIDCSGTSPATKCGNHNYYVEPGAGARTRYYVGPAVRCPDGMPCKIHCGPGGCSGNVTILDPPPSPYYVGRNPREAQAVLRCPADASCEVDCTAGGCATFNVQCGNDHPCTLDCAGPTGNNSCGYYLIMRCGSGRCEIQGGHYTAKIECGASCDCPRTPFKKYTPTPTGFEGVQQIPCGVWEEYPCVPRWTPWP